MQKSTIPFLLTSVFAFSALVSCASYSVDAAYVTVATNEKSVRNPYFADPATDYVYKANITVYGNELTGIFIAKKINGTTHRVVFTTEFGNKLLDFEISETEFKVNAIVDELNKKILVNTLKTDFRLLLKTDFPIAEKLQKSTGSVYKSNDGNASNYLYISASDNKLYQITHASKTKEKIKILFTSENNIFAEKIVIQHYNIQLRIALHYFKQN